MCNKSVQCVADLFNGSKYLPGMMQTPEHPLKKRPLSSLARYGENPHQKAAFYKDQSLREAKAGGVATSVVHWGKEMSYNNYLDADAAYQVVWMLVGCQLDVGWVSVDG